MTSTLTERKAGLLKGLRLTFKSGATAHQLRYYVGTLAQVREALRALQTEGLVTDVYDGRHQLWHEVRL